MSKILYMTPFFLTLALPALYFTPWVLVGSEVKAKAKFSEMLYERDLFEMVT